MAVHILKVASEIEAEIQRRAQGEADAKGDPIEIVMPGIERILEPTLHGSHWILCHVGQAGIPYVERAAIKLAKSWDLRRS